MKKANSLLTGFLAGLFLPALIFAGYFTIRDPLLRLTDVIRRLFELKVLSHYISLCAIANLALFFLFLKWNAERSARGVLGATILYAFLILLLTLS